MDHDLRHPPWTGRGLIPEDVFIREVEESLNSTGHWETYGEFRMGAGPTVSVDVTSVDGEKVYRAQAVWMATSLRMSGDYTTLSKALEVLPQFGGALFDLLTAGCGSELVETDEEWPKYSK